MEHARSADQAEDTFESVYATYFAKLVRHSIVKGLPDPEGYAHEVLIQFWKKYDHSRMTPPGVFLWRLARDMAVDERRRLERRPELELVEEVQQDRGTAPDRLAAAAQVLGRLSQEEREAVEMWLFGMSGEQIALEWDCRLEEATLRVSRAISATLLAAGGEWEKLNDAQREAIAMSLSGASYVDMAAAWVCTHAAAKMRVSRAFKVAQLASRNTVGKLVHGKSLIQR